MSIRKIGPTLGSFLLSKAFPHRNLRFFEFDEELCLLVTLLTIFCSLFDSLQRQASLHSIKVRQKN